MHLHFALFQGEVGWEIAQWIPLCRALVNQHKPRRVTADCRPGFEYFYEDFAEPAPMPIDPKLRSDMIFAYRGKIKSPQKSPFRSRGADRVVVVEQYACVPDHNGVPELDAKKQYRTYGEEFDISPVPDTIGIHARMISRNPERNWKWWAEFTKKFPERFRKIMWLGGKDDWFPAPYLRESLLSEHLDLRNVAAPVAVSAMKKCEFVMGASSGTMHIAQHAKVPVMVWSGNESKDGPRWSHAWNPLHTKHRFIKGWQPDVDVIIRESEGWRPSA